MAVAMDVASEDQVQAAVSEVVAAYDGVEVLVSNAGIQIVAKDVARATPYSMDRQ